MSLPVSRVGDLTTGHDCHPPQEVEEGSLDVIINGKPVARVGDPVSPHACGGSPHDGEIIEGSSTIFVNGKPMTMVGCDVLCPAPDIVSEMAEGSPNVFGTM